MIRSKYFGLAAVAFAMLSLGACTTDSNDNNLAISGNPRLDNSALTAGGAAVSVRGTITNDAGNISYTLKVQNSTTGADATSSFVLAYKAPTTSETSWSIGDPAQGAGTITALASAATGSYNLVITATSGTATTSATVPFTVTGGTGNGTTTTEHTGNVYNYLSKNKGAYSLAGDSGVSSSTASTYKDLQDLIASDNQHVFDGSLTSPNGAAFVKANSFDYSNATSGANGSIATAYAAGVPLTQISAPSVGDIYLVKLASGAFVALKVTAIVPGSVDVGNNAGSITFSYRK